MPKHILLPLNPKALDLIPKVHYQVPRRNRREQKKADRIPISLFVGVQ